MLDRVLLLAILLGSSGCGSASSSGREEDDSPTVDPSGFHGSRAGEEREVAGIRLCWCPPGTFVMGSPPGEPERRPGEEQVEVTLTRGFWMSKHEVTQADWKRISGRLPGAPTAELPEDDALPVGNVSFAEAEAFCRELTAKGRASGALP